jgi:hypothetical protein
MFILLPTCEAYSSIARITLALLERYWPGHLPVRMVMGQGAAWLEGVVGSLSDCKDELFILLLDDYALCGPAKSATIAQGAELMRGDESVGMFPLCWYPARERLPRIDCSNIVILKGTPILLQAAIWRRRWFLELAETIDPRASASSFELAATQISRTCQRDICAIKMPQPAWTRGNLIDGFDKTDWPLPYHNLMHRGRYNLEHEAFLWSEGFRFPSRGLGDTVAAIANTTGVASVAKVVERLTGRECGCGQRRERLNDLLPY